MVAERRERRGAAPTSWIPPEPAGKGKPLGSKKKAASGATKKKQPAKTAATSAASAASDSVAHPASAAGQAAVSHVGGAAAIAGGGEQHHAAEHGGGLGQDDYTLDALQSATSTANPTVSGGSGPIETETGEQLFCICMGVDNGTPMIFCEACENWYAGFSTLLAVLWFSVLTLLTRFHFECIGLSEEDASRIATYYCDQCEQAGSGKTECGYPYTLPHAVIMLTWRRPFRTCNRSQGPTMHHQHLMTYLHFLRRPHSALHHLLKMSLFPSQQRPIFQLLFLFPP